jgi:hypothetical protein
MTREGRGHKMRSVADPTISQRPTAHSSAPRPFPPAGERAIFLRADFAYGFAFGAGPMETESLAIDADGEHPLPKIVASKSTA